MHSGTVVGADRQGEGARDRFALEAGPDNLGPLSSSVEGTSILHALTARNSVVCVYGQWAAQFDREKRPESKAYQETPSAR